MLITRDAPSIVKQFTKVDNSRGELKPPMLYRLLIRYQRKAAGITLRSRNSVRDLSRRIGKGRGVGEGGEDRYQAQVNPRSARSARGSLIDSPGEIARAGTRGREGKEYGREGGKGTSAGYQATLPSA